MKKNKLQNKNFYRLIRFKSLVTLYSELRHVSAFISSFTQRSSLLLAQLPHSIFQKQEVLFRCLYNFDANTRRYFLLRKLFEVRVHNYVQFACKRGRSNYYSLLHSSTTSQDSILNENILGLANGNVYMFFSE